MKNIDQLFLKVNKTVEEGIVNYNKAFFNAMVKEGLMASRSELLKMDRIDFYLCLKPEDHDDDTDLPEISQDPNFVKTWIETIPPFENGVLRINKHCYIRFMMENIYLDEKKWEAVLVTYSFDKGVWYLTNFVEATLEEDSDRKLRMAWRGNTLPDILEANYRSVRDKLKDELKGVYETDDDNYNIDHLHELVLHEMRKQEPENAAVDISKSIAAHFIQAIYATNKALSERKPRPIRSKGTGAKVKTAKGEPDMDPKPKITRALINGIEITSRKIPRVPSEETIRHYRVAEWNTRGHLRHYRNGKTTYIKPSIHHRKCLEGVKTGVAQNVIKVY